jgi:hypothetical protein
VRFEHTGLYSYAYALVLVCMYPKVLIVSCNKCDASHPNVMVVCTMVPCNYVFTSIYKHIYSHLIISKSKESFVSDKRNWPSDM